MIVFSFINCKPAAIDEIQSPTHEKFHTFLFSFTFLNFFEHRMLVGFKVNFPALDDKQENALLPILLIFFRTFTLIARARC